MELIRHDPLPQATNEALNIDARIRSRRPTKRSPDLVGVRNVAFKVRQRRLELATA